MTAKIRIKMGQVEVEYEGPEDFLRAELKDLLSGVMELHRERGGNEPSDINSGADQEGQKPNDGSDYIGTTNTFAAKLGVKSGPDLIIAAMAQKTLVGKKEKVTRTELLQEMHTATSYYKKSYSANLTKNLKSLVTSDKLREVAADTYALSASELDRVKKAYAG